MTADGRGRAAPGSGPRPGSRVAAGRDVPGRAAAAATPPATAMLATAASTGIPAPPPVAAELFGTRLGVAERYVRLLAGAGVERGLIGPGEVPRLWTRHVLNCAVVAELVPAPGSLIDVGSGAGLPGLVLAMLLPDVSVTLLERMGRRAGFLRECVAALGLGNATVVEAQAAEVAGKMSADVVTARAVAPLAALVPMALPLVRPGGLLLAIKGAGAAAEVAAARPVLRRLRVRDVTVVNAGSGKVEPAATVVRLVAGP